MKSKLPPTQSLLSFLSILASDPCLSPLLLKYGEGMPFLSPCSAEAYGEFASLTDLSWSVSFLTWLEERIMKGHIIQDDAVKQ